MSFKKLTLISFILVVLMTGIITPTMAQEFTIGFSQMENNMPFRIAETNSIKNIEEKYPEVDVIVTDAQSSLSKQISDCMDLISRGVDILAIAPREYEGFQTVFDAAKEKDIPVILVDREAKGVPGEDFETMIGANFWYEGRQAAVYLSAKMEGEGNIVELIGTAGSSVARDREGGFHQVVEYFPDMKIIASQPADFTRMEALNVMENIIQQHNDKIDAVYAHNDEMALGAIQALNAAGMVDDVLIVSIDGQKSAIKSIMDGNLDASIECPPYFGDILYETSKKILNGEDIPPKVTITDARIFTKANAEYHYDRDSEF